MNKSVIAKFDSLYKKVMERKESKVVEIIDGCKIVGVMDPIKDPLGVFDIIYFWGFDCYRKTEKGRWKLMYKGGSMLDWTEELNGTEDLVRHLKYLMFDWYYSPLIRLGEEEKKTWIRLFGSNGKEWNEEVRKIKETFEYYGFDFNRCLS
jgi:hypothetical protein